MPFVELEQPDGSLARKEVTYEERRRLLQASEPACRFIKPDGTVVLTIGDQDPKWLLEGWLQED